MAHCVRVLSAQAWVPEVRYQYPLKPWEWPGRSCKPSTMGAGRRMTGAKWPNSRFGEKLSQEQKWKWQSKCPESLLWSPHAHRHALAQSSLAFIFSFLTKATYAILSPSFLITVRNEKIECLNGESYETHPKNSGCLPQHASGALLTYLPLRNEWCLTAMHPSNCRQNIFPLLGCFQWIQTIQWYENSEEERIK